MAKAQVATVVNFRCSGKDSIALQLILKENNRFTDSLGLNEIRKNGLLQLNKLGYLTATYLEQKVFSDTLEIIVQEGKVFTWVRLGNGNVDEDILSQAGFRQSRFTNQKFNPETYVKYAERILQITENAGYPFAILKLDSIQLDTGGISAVWNLDKHILVLFDTIHRIGNAGIKSWYLQKYLGIKPESVYEESLITQVNSRLSQLPFLQTTQPPKVYFYGNHAMPYLYINERKASSVDGILGFAPNSKDNGKTLLLTGEVNLKLQNLFESGKTFDLYYRSFLGNSQELRINFLYPYFLKSKIGLDYHLYLLKQDTNFLDVNQEFGAQYRFIGTDYIRMYIMRQTTSLITVDTNKIKSNGSIPDANDVLNVQYGLSFKITRFDYFLNPRKGFSIEVGAGIGNKTIIRNPTIEALVFYDNQSAPYSVYDKVDLQSIQYRINFSAEKYFPVLTRFALRLQVSGADIQSENLLLNELFRIGGIRTLKGFDEQSIFANRYIIANTECRYLLQQNSNLILFWNGAYYENTVPEVKITDKPYGFGVGINMESKAGVFSLYYALGKAFNNPVELSKAKVHFGFVNYF